MARILSPPSPQDSNSNMVCFLILSTGRSANSIPFRQQTPDLSKRNKYWWRVIGRVLSTLLARSSYSEETKAGYDEFFKSTIAPLLGPTPDEFVSTSSTPVSFMCDDHTPAEIAWVFKSTGETSVQYAIETLTASDGSPISTPQNLSLLQHLSVAGRCQGFDISWSRKCTQSLLHPTRSLPQDLQRMSQFFIGKRVRRLYSGFTLTSNRSQASTLAEMGWV